jgi:chromosome segregation ATPase
MKINSDGQDSEELRNLLKSITQELSHSFIERRSKNKTHKSNPLDELSDAISELNNREKDLQAAVGIALMLLDNKENLESKIHNCKNKILQLKDKCLHLTIENKSMKESLITLEEKNDEIKKTLTETEEAMLITSKELQIALREKLSANSDIKSEAEINEIKKELTQNLENLENKIKALEKENKKCIENKNTVQNELIKLKEDHAKLISDHQQTISKLQEFKKKAKDTEIKLEECKKSKEIFEDQLKVANSNCERLKVNSERLEEEILLFNTQNSRSQDFGLNDNKKPQRSKYLKHQSSLLSELSMLEHPEGTTNPSNRTDEFSEEILFIKHQHHHTMTPFNRYSSIESYSKLFSIRTSNHIKIYPTKNGRKSPSEEYFLLSAQVIIMNSIHMENICSVSPQALYEKALMDQIPFHKWHQWIEKQLNAAYLQSLYQKKNKFYWTKTSQKKQFIMPA